MKIQRFRRFKISPWAPKQRSLTNTSNEFEQPDLKESTKEIRQGRQVIKSCTEGLKVGIAATPRLGDPERTCDLEDLMNGMDGSPAVCG